MARWIKFTLAIVCTAAVLAAQTQSQPQRIDQEYSAKIKEYLQDSRITTVRRRSSSKRLRAERTRK